MHFVCLRLLSATARFCAAPPSLSRIICPVKNTCDVFNDNLMGSVQAFYMGIAGESNDITYINNRPSNRKNTLNHFNDRGRISVDEKVKLHKLFHSVNHLDVCFRFLHKVSVVVAGADPKYTSYECEFTATRIKIIMQFALS